MMGKINDLLNTIGFIAVEIGYLVWGVFLLIGLPLMNSLAPSNSLIGRIRLPFSCYTGIIGLLYILSAFYISRRKRVGLKFALVANILGIPLIMPIVIGLASLYYFTRPKVKQQFMERVLSETEASRKEQFR